MTWLLQPLDLHTIHVTGPLSAKVMGYPVRNVLVNEN